MSKFSLEFKDEVVESILKTNCSISEVSKKYGIDKTSIKEWIALYKYRKANGSKRQQTQYDRQYKIDVIKYMYEHYHSVFEIVEIFGISRFSVKVWKREYDENGDNAFLTNGVLGMKKDTNNSSKKDLKELENENYHLRMENDYLKKKWQLIQEMEKLDKKKK